METKSYYSNDTIEYVPVSHAEEKELFKRFYAGDPANMSEDALAARDAILTNNLRYAALSALRHSSRRQYQQDLTSAANAGLLKALESRRFQPDKGRFTTFATKYIIGEICSFFRVACAVSFPAGCLPDWPEDGRSEPEVDTLPDPSSFLPENLDFGVLHEAIQTLESTERQIIELIYFSGHNVSSARHFIDCGEGKIGVGRQWATELRDRGLAKLRVALGASELKEAA